MEQFGAKLKRIRSALGLTQKRLAEQLCVPQSYLAKVEAGVDVRFSNARRIADAMGLEVSISGDPLHLLQNPPRGSVIERARDFGIDLAQLYENYKLSPQERWERFKRNRRTLAAIR